jgi:hypothetical protein
VTITRTEMRIGWPRSVSPSRSWTTRGPAPPRHWSTGGLPRRRGYLDGRSLAEVFAWLRGGDLAWNYWGNNLSRIEVDAYLSGHAAALVNPPDSPKASYQVTKENPADPQVRKACGPGS